MSWHASLELHYLRRLRADDTPHTVVQHQRSGPLHVLQSLYPEGPAVCHNVIVHPPGGLVGGDKLAMQLQLDAGTHALLTTPGATRFYRSDQLPAQQTLRANLSAHSRLEWLPMETLAYSGCQARNELVFNLAEGAELMGWDITALGLPEANLPFTQGEITQRIELPGAWLEYGQLAANDARLMDSPLGLGGRRCIASLFFAAGTTLALHRHEAALDAVRNLIDAHPQTQRLQAGATLAHPQVLVLRVLADRVEPAMALLQSARAAWRQTLWDMAPVVPRLWRM